MKQKRFSGFTLIEILIVVILFGILTVITFVAINPAKNFLDTRNTQRSSDIIQILDAIYQFTTDNNHRISDLGNIPLCPDTSNIISAGVPDVDEVNLAAGPTGNGLGLVDTYIVAIPKDPKAPLGADSGYTICTTSLSAGRVQIAAPLAEGDRQGQIIVKR